MPLDLTAAPPLSASFDRWLNGSADAPVAVALSGGGDSLALLHLAKRWADGAGRRLLALTVDHGLQSAGAEWARFAAERSGRLGIPHRTLAWTGEKPKRGLPAAARGARHALLADAARQAGAAVILMAHTADDVGEAEVMRAAGSTTPSPRIWSPSPVWPAGRNVFVLRPLLAARREDLRAFLRNLGETWIEDPANDDPSYARTLARRRLAEGSQTTEFSDGPTACRFDLSTVRSAAAGVLGLPRPPVLHLSPAMRRRLLGALVLCAAGTTRPPVTERLDRLAERLVGRDDVTATLAGARIEARGDNLLVCRDAGEADRRGIGLATLPVGESVFDGRFLIEAAATGAQIGFLKGHAARLPRRERQALAAIPAAARGALPAIISPQGDVTSPVLSETAAFRATELGHRRLRATLGDFPDEASLWRVAELTTGA